MVKTRQDFESLKKSSNESARSNHKIVRDLKLTDKTLRQSMHRHDSDNGSSREEKSLESCRSSLQNFRLINRSFEAPKRS